MADELKLRKQAERGARAEALLNNDLLQEAFDKIESALMDEWRNTGAEDGQRREDAWRSHKLLQNLKGYLKKVVIDGAAANKQLLQIKQPTLVDKVLNR